METSIETNNSCRFILSDNEGNISYDKTFSNITCIPGRTSLASILIDTSNTVGLGLAKYIAVGTDATGATVNDTKLWAETHRSAIDTDLSTQTTITTKVYARFWLGEAYTVSEAGLFIDASATSSADTWSLLCRSIPSPAIVKTTDKVLTLEWSIVMNNYVL